MFATANTPPLGGTIQIRPKKAARYGCFACGGKVFLADKPV